jgi:hypothetical protein
VTTLTKEQSAAEREVEILKSQVSQYAMALDLLATMSHLDTEKRAIENILEIFTALFAPRKLYFLALTEENTGRIYSSLSLSREDQDSIRDSIVRSIENFAWSESANGFLIKISHLGIALGVVDVGEISFPEYRDDYLNLALSIVDICGLAIGNARKTEQLKNSEHRLRLEKAKVERALVEVKTLSGLLPICMHCKKIRDDKGYWNQIEAYIETHSEAEFSHGICQECVVKYYSDEDDQNN